MSRYIRILNNIKTNITSLTLTPSQEACRARIEERLAYPGVVNLYGLPGVGKTVLGWAMAAAGKVIYVSHPTRCTQVDLRAAPIIFVDNAEADRASFRRLLGTLESAGSKRVVVVTRSPVDDYVFRAEINLTDTDIATVQHNLAGLGYQASGQGYANLWQLLLQIAREGQ
jgi:hypothetical protein